MQYFNDRAVRSDNVLFIQNKSKFVKAHTTSGHKHAIDEIFLDPAVSGRLGDVKAIQEVSIYVSFTIFHHYFVYLFVGTVVGTISQHAWQ